MPRSPIKSCKPTAYYLWISTRRWCLIDSGLPKALRMILMLTNMKLDAILKPASIFSPRSTSGPATRIVSASTGCRAWQVLGSPRYPVP
ncbi:hypothetical protein FOCG_18401 [Fusarium oxysporum f. sp. radicis-lycopersici 26381]|nr:hypothetical protein FOCG_18401 [Fusarium oxysporum f. sp. radicis-lycopersici 26381]